MSADKIRLLVVEDEYLVALDMVQQLESAGYEAIGPAASETEAVSLALSQKPDLILMDINLASGGDGISAAHEIRKHLNVPIVYVTAYTSEELVRRSGTTAPYGYVVKPFTLPKLRASIETALSRWRYEQAMDRSEKRFRAAVQASEMAVWEFDLEDRTITLEGWLAERLKPASDGVIECSESEFFELLQPSDAERLSELLHAGQAVTEKLRIRVDPEVQGARETEDGEFWVQLTVSEMTASDGRIRIGAIRNITQEESRLRALRLSTSILASINEVVIVVDEDHRIKAVNPSFHRETGYALKEMLGQSAFDLIQHDRDSDSIQDLVQAAMVDGQSVVVRRKNGGSYDALMTGSRLTEAGTFQNFMILILTDVTRLRRAERHLSKLAFQDHLTGLGNRNYLNRLIQDLRERPEGRRKGALFFLDLDSFKLINDTLGHDAGDEILIQFSRRLKNFLRDQDHLIRLGGDEFVFFFDQLESREDLNIIAEKIVQSANGEPFQVASRALTVSCSIGIALLSEVNEDLNSLLKHADIAMYEAKRQGKNAFVFFDESQSSYSHYRLFVEQGVRQAIVEDRICAWWQPIVDARTGKVTQLEALCRWHDPKIGIIPPGDFIGVAEETGLINLIGLKVLRDAAIQCRLLQDAGYPDMKVAVNVSSKQLVSPDIVEVIEEILREAGVQPSALVIEVTESIFQLGQAVDILSQFQALGMTVAIDDFGTGFSSLSRLRNISVDELKIDRSFVQGALSCSKQKAITEVIIELGKKLGMHLVAEGIETEEEHAFMNARGVNALQGYLFARPMPSADLMDFLEKQAPSGPRPAP